MVSDLLSCFSKPHKIWGVVNERVDLFTEPLQPEASQFSTVQISGVKRKLQDYQLSCPRFH